MFHQDVDPVIPQFVLPDWELLETHIILEHFPEMDRHWLTDGAVDRIIDVQLFKGVVARIKYTKYTDNSIVIDFVITEVER